MNSHSLYAILPAYFLSIQRYSRKLRVQYFSDAMTSPKHYRGHSPKNTEKKTELLALHGYMVRSKPKKKRKTKVTIDWDFQNDCRQEGVNIVEAQRATEDWHTRKTILKLLECVHVLPWHQNKKKKEEWKCLFILCPFNSVKASEDLIHSCHNKKTNKRNQKRKKK